MRIENVIGKPVLDRNFFGRDTELEELQAISEREHVLMLAPRRVGKTSLLRALMKRVDEDGSAIGVYASVAAATTEPQFVQAVLNAIYATKRGRKLKRGIVARTLGLGRGIKSVKIASSGVDLEHPTPAWQEDADRAFAAIFTSKTPLLILIDELPVLVLALSKSDPSGARVRAFLQWFRHLRQHPAGAATLRFILAGSIGLDNVTRRHQLTDTINDLRPWLLGPFDRPAAHEFLEQLAASYSLVLSPELCGAICDAAEWLIPYHLQVVFGALREQARASQPSVELLQGVLESLIDRRIYFSYWDERLRDSLGAPTDSLARAMLAACARTAEGATLDAMRQAVAALVPDAVERAATLKWILEVLVNDGYLVEQALRWRFRSGLLRRYWLRHVA
ncbi:MAG TPA: ATP-binding protein [Kofleriaceae bacterium]|nr:ATP-binding protein [Kofleriaceae bacterium]